MIPEWFPTPDNFMYHEAVASLDSAVYGIIDARRRELAASPQPSQVRTLPSMHMSASYSVLYIYWHSKLYGSLGLGAMMIFSLA